MPIKAVHLSAEAYIVCLTHALSTEKEEIMGLLIGDISPEHISYISAVILLRRSCKQADRLEISPEQLSAASTQAEEFGHMLDRPMRVIGWYHSHPHITVWPSHIDVRTQADYQLMDAGFVGLIFSIFNHDKVSKMNRVQVSCFQSTQIDSMWERVEVQLHIDLAESINMACMTSMVNLPSILREEEDEAYARTNQVSALDIMTRVHNGAVYTSGMIQIDERMYRPLLETMEHRNDRKKKELKELQMEEQKLKHLLTQIKNKDSKMYDLMV
jgi:BRCA1/BRCA2-containing complex subunit 3